MWRVRDSEAALRSWSMSFVSAPQTTRPGLPCGFDRRNRTLTTASDKPSPRETADSLVDDRVSYERVYLTPEEFAQVSGLSLSTVRRYLANGKLPKCQPGGPRCRVLIPRGALVQLAPSEVDQGDRLATGLDNTSSVGSQSKHNQRRRGPVPRWRR